jgi:hypothetical protein
MSPYPRRRLFLERLEERNPASDTLGAILAGLSLGDGLFYPAQPANPPPI